MWSSLKNYTDAALLLIRAALGCMLLRLHAWKLLSAAYAFWVGHGMHHDFWGGIWASALAIAETLSCILLIIGLWTRPAALLIGALVARVAWADFRGGGIGHAELHIDLALLLLIFLVTGPGRFSVDKA